MIDRFKREMGKINITQVAAHRGDVALAVQKALTADAMDLFGMSIVDFQINDIRFTEQYRRAVDAAAIAKAKVEQAEQERRQAEVVAQRQTIKRKVKPTPCASKLAVRPTVNSCSPQRARSWWASPRPRRCRCRAKHCAPIPRSSNLRWPSAGRGTPQYVWQRAVTTLEPARRNSAAHRPLRAPPIQSRGGLA